jgi:hypothetical protein
VAGEDGRPDETPDEAPDEAPGQVPEARVVLRPDVVVLRDEALLPASNVVRPAPARLTHELVVDEPYHLDRAERGPQPDGVLPAGTRVAVLLAGEDRCRVVDARGLAVDVRRASLRALPEEPGR